MDDDELIDPYAVDEEGELLFSDLMDINAEMQERAARRARELNAAAEVYEELAMRSRAQAVLEAATALQLSRQTGDLIQTEFGISDETFEVEFSGDDSDEGDGVDYE